MLDQKVIAFEFLPHRSEGNTIAASKIRGHCLSEAAKSMLVVVRESKQSSSKIVGYFLAVLPGDRHLNFKAVARYARGRRAELANEDELARLLMCESGSVPPFSFSESVKVLVDKSFKSDGLMVFNAGRLDRSIAIRTEYYLREFDYPMMNLSKAPANAQLH